MNRKRFDCNSRVLCSVVGLANMTFSVIKEIKAKSKKKQKNKTCQLSHFLIEYQSFFCLLVYHKFNFSMTGN